MRVLLAVVMLMSTAVAAHAQCNGRIGTTRPTKSWGTMQVCLDDKYSTCIQNNLKGGVDPAGGHSPLRQAQGARRSQVAVRW
jgi:hypothetical protein